MDTIVGTGVALATPFTDDGEVDYQGLERLLNHTAPQVDYLVVNGTTGESPTLSKAEKVAVLDFVVANNKWKKPVVFGLGSNNTAALLKELKEDYVKKADAILSVTPQYNKPSQQGLYTHFKAVADASPVPVILYNVPARTSCNLEAQTTIRLAEHPNIVGIKEAAGDMAQAIAIARETPEDFLLISGDDLLTLPLISIGGKGVISVAANAYPKEFSEIVRAALAGKPCNSPDHWLYELSRFNTLLYKEGNPVGIKALLEILGICQAKVRLPLVEASKELKEALKEKALHLENA
ncbi:4-hydroxy-tetrahydrodipicolinate synthase [Rapidithrix thailandica]|uniref:4-hydroxy-tetrahydrodipicolinate synthase n=1 Tax=Rapidithrix thailandica TaxID=413964 RepID=A0AAW9SBQ6_9BACT